MLLLAAMPTEVASAFPRGETGWEPAQLSEIMRGRGSSESGLGSRSHTGGTGTRGDASCVVLLGKSRDALAVWSNRGFLWPAARFLDKKQLKISNLLL